MNAWQRKADQMRPILAEVQAAAVWCARNGYRGVAGDPLPALMSLRAVEYINREPVAFYARVVWAKHYLAQS